MRLIRHGEAGYEEPGVLLPDGRRVDASGEFHDYDEGFFASGGLEALEEWVSGGCSGGYDVDASIRLGPPVARPSKIVCVGKNYLDHAKEFGEGVPTEPALFMKATSAWSGPTDDIMIPRGAERLDYEVELAVNRAGLQRFRDFTVVFAQVGESYEVRMLELGRQDETHVEILSGLKPGTTYVTEQSFLIKADIEKSGASHDH